MMEFHKLLNFYDYIVNMKRIYKVLILSFIIPVVTLLEVQAAETIKIPSSDGIEIVVDLYKIHPDTVPFIILFHQAGWSRGEYLEIAPKLNALGYNCLAVDQRSGNSINGVDNNTFENAKKAMKQTRYIDAYRDVQSVIAHTKKFLAKGKVIIWGSSYSSSLVLKYAGENPEKIDGALAFSPGEYFKQFGKPGDYIQSSVSGISCPVFITSSRSEKSSWWTIYEAIPSQNKSYFLPETSGNHGSRALWSKFSDSMNYWDAVKDFLSGI